MSFQKPEKARPYHDFKNKNQQEQNNANINEVDDDEEMPITIITLKDNDLIDIDITDYSFQDSYYYFKKYEKKVFKAYKKANQEDMINISDKILKYRNLLLKFAQQILEEHVYQASQKCIEQRIWDIFRKELESKKNFLFEEKGVLIFEEKIQFFQSLKIHFQQEKFKYITQSEMNFNNKERRMLANIYCYLGEIQEIKEKLNPNQSRKKTEEDVKLIAQLYYKAIIIYPYNSKYFLLMANLQKLNNNIMQCFYWCLRTYCSENQFVDPQPIIDKLIEENRKNYFSKKSSQDFNKIIVNQIPKGEALQLFHIFYIRYIQVIFTRSNQKKLSELVQMFEFLERYINILKQNQDIIIAREANNLFCLVMVVIISMYYTIEGIQKNQDEKRLKKSIPQMENDEYITECLKFSQGILLLIIDLVIFIDDENYLNLLIPIIYYLTEYKNQSYYFFFYYKNFQQVMIKLYNELKKRMDSIQSIDKQEIEKQAEEKFTNLDIQLCGFIPLKYFYQNFKKSKYLIINDQTKQLPCKLYILIKLIPMLKGYDLSLEKIQQNNNDKTNDQQQLININVQSNNDEDEMIQLQQKAIQTIYDDLEDKEEQENDYYQQNFKFPNNIQNNLDNDQKNDFKDDFFWESSNNVDAQQQDEKIDSQIQNNFKKEIEQSLKELPNQQDENIQRTMILVDGMNVAIRYGQDKRFASKGLKLAVDYWVQRKHNILILLPDFCFNKEEATKKQCQYKSQNQQMKLKYIPDDVGILLELKDKGYATGIPNWNNDDSYVIDYARQKNAYILTNDRYNDHINFYVELKEREKLKQWIRNNCISFTFIKEELVPDPDFLKSKNIKQY